MKRTYIVSTAILITLLFLIPTYSALYTDDIEYYISAGIARQRWGKIGLGYIVLVRNNGEDNIEGVCYVNQTTLSGEKILNSRTNFMIGPSCEFGKTGFTIINPSIINKIDITLKVENISLSKSGYEIGPIVVLMD